MTAPSQPFAKVLNVGECAVLDQFRRNFYEFEFRNRKIEFSCEEPGNCFVPERFEPGVVSFDIIMVSIGTGAEKRAGYSIIRSGKYFFYDCFPDLHVFTPTIFPRYSQRVQPSGNVRACGGGGFFCPQGSDGGHGFELAFNRKGAEVVDQELFLFRKPGDGS